MTEEHIYPQGTPASAVDFDDEPDRPISPIGSTSQEAAARRRQRNAARLEALQINDEDCACHRYPYENPDEAAA